MKPRFVALVGPTASGKTDLAVTAVERSGIGVEILVLDSRQLYRGLEVGTGKPDAAQRARVRHHLLDCLELTVTPDAMDYRRRVEVATREILARGNVPFLVGGAGFYLRALREGFHQFEYDADELAETRARHSGLSDGELVERLRGLDPASAERLHPNDRYRIGRAIELCELSGRPASELEQEFRPSPLLDGTFSVALLMPDRDVLHERIARRTARWLGGGWQREVGDLLSAGVPADAPGMQILGYRQVVQLVRGEADPETVEGEIVVATRRYARAQRTWFRKESPALRFERSDEVALEQLTGLLREAGGSP